jgi:2-oxo-4-hydroxy-4-carboxy--5-ureidoimidazoline (OHCU) decarboxylase
MSPKLAELNAGTEEDFVAALGPVYEHSPLLRGVRQGSGCSRTSTTCVMRCSRK